MKTITGLIKATSGSITFDGNDITRTPSHERAGLGVCHIPEGSGILRSLTVRENLTLQSVPGTEPDSIARAIEVFPILGERSKRQAGTLSGDQQ